MEVLKNLFPQYGSDWPKCMEIRARGKPLHVGKTSKPLLHYIKKILFPFLFFNFCKVASLIKQWDAIGCCDSYIVSYSSLFNLFSLWMWCSAMHALSEISEPC